MLSGLKNFLKVFKIQNMTVPGQWSKCSIIFFMGLKLWFLTESYSKDPFSHTY